MSFDDSKLLLQHPFLKDKKQLFFELLKGSASNLSSGLPQTSQAICSKPLERFAAFSLTGPTGCSERGVRRCNC